MAVVLFVFRVIAAITSLVMILSPVPTVIKIHKSKSVGVTSIIPLASVVANCHVWTLHGALNQNYFPVVAAFGSGLVISIGYVVTYYRWSTEKRYVGKVLAATFSFILLLTLYGVLGYHGYFHESRRQVTHIVGYIAITVAIVLYGSPFSRVFQVFKYKSAVFIPIHMVLAGTTNNAAWVVYTTLDKYWFMFIPNFCGLVFGILQIAVYLMYFPKTHPYVPQAHPAETEDALPMAVPVTRVPSAVMKSDSKVLHDDDTLSIEIVVSPTADENTSSDDGHDFQLLQSPAARSLQEPPETAV